MLCKRWMFISARWYIGNSKVVLRAVTPAAGMSHFPPSDRISLLQIPKQRMRTWHFWDDQSQFRHPLPLRYAKEGKFVNQIYSFCFGTPPSAMEFSVSSKGKPCVLYNGYRYTKRIDNKCGTTTYECDHRNCRVSLVLRDKTVVREPSLHKCVPDETRISVQSAIDKAKTRAREDVKCSIPKVIYFVIKINIFEGLCQRNCFGMVILWKSTGIKFMQFVYLFCVCKYYSNKL